MPWGRSPKTLQNTKPRTSTGTGLFSSRVDDGIPPLGARQSLCFRKGARREVSLRLSREDCHRQSSPTTTCGCRGFESRHANDKKPHTLAGTGLICCSRVVNGGRKKILHLNCLFSIAYEKNINIWC